MDTIKRQDAAVIVLNRLKAAATKLHQGGNISDVISKTQSEILEELLLHNIKPSKQLHPFTGADEINHLKGGTIIGIVDADSNDPDSGMRSDCLIIEIEKDGELHELAFQDGEWFTLSFKSAEEEPAELEKQAQPICIKTSISIENGSNVKNIMHNLHVELAKRYSGNLISKQY